MTPKPHILFYIEILEPGRAHWLYEINLKLVGVVASHAVNVIYTLCSHFDMLLTLFVPLLQAINYMKDFLFDKLLGVLWRLSGIIPRILCLHQNNRFSLQKQIYDKWQYTDIKIIIRGGSIFKAFVGTCSPIPRIKSLEEN